MKQNNIVHSKNRQREYRTVGEFINFDVIICSNSRERLWFMIVLHM